jgi:hypothetical protein
MGDTSGATCEPVRGSSSAIADQLLAFAEAGVNHVQLVVDPITRSSIERLGPVVDSVRRRHP